MFDTVLGQAPTQRRIGAGAILSISFHAALLCGALWFSARAVAPHGASKGPVIDFWPRAAAGARAGTPSAATRHAPPAHHSVPRHDLIPAAPVPTPAIAPEPTPEPAAASDAPTTGGPVGPDGMMGDPNGACTGPNCAATGAGTGPEGPGGGGPPSTEVIPFGPGMSPMVLLSSAPIQMPPEAAAAHVHGQLIIECQITETGAVAGCRALQSVPLMDEAVIHSFMQRRYAPITFQGHTVSVRFRTTVKVVAE
jgi:TonB-like protein